MAQRETYEALQLDHNNTQQLTAFKLFFWSHTLSHVAPVWVKDVRNGSSELQSSLEDYKTLNPAFSSIIYDFAHRYARRLWPALERRRAHLAAAKVRPQTSTSELKATLDTLSITPEEQEELESRGVEVTHEMATVASSIGSKVKAYLTELLLSKNERVPVGPMSSEVLLQQILASKPHSTSLPSRRSLVVGNPPPSTRAVHENPPSRKRARDSSIASVTELPERFKPVGVEDGEPARKRARVDSITSDGAVWDGKSFEVGSGLIYARVDYPSSEGTEETPFSMSGLPFVQEEAPVGCWTYRGEYSALLDAYAGCDWTVVV